MRKKILNYVKKIDDLLENPPEHIDYEEEEKQHLIQIQFFMHERLVHEIVMVLFAIATVMVSIVTVLFWEIYFVALLIGLLILLVPYVMHYYVLENSVQHMYEQYDIMEARRRSKSIS